MYFQRLKSVFRTLALASVALTPIALTAQDAPKPAPKTNSADSPSRWDIFAGYSYLAPKGTVNVPQPDGTTLPFDYNAVNVGGLFSGAYYFNKYVGGQVEYGLHEWGDADQNGSNVGTKGNDDGFQTISGGIIFRFPMEDITPFVHGLVGAAQINGPDFNPNRWGPDLTAGGGMDYATPFLNHHLSIRVFQADYEYMHADFGPNVYGGRANINAARLSGGLVFHVGSIAPPAPPTIACSANPTTVFPGDPVTVTATASGLNPKENAIYAWSGDGVTGSGTTATVATGSLAPGSYTVKCGVKEGKPGREGLKPWQVADSSTTFTVKDFEPPTISCSANPTTINPGDSATITATAVSPQNRPLTYSYTATAGTVSGTGATANYSSAGAPSGTTEVTCNVADDKGHSATANASLTIAPPPPPPGPSPEQLRLEARLALHSVFFPTAQPRAKHPEGGLVESQQQTLNTLATDFKAYLAIKPDGRITLTGHADVRGTAEYNQALTERRVNRVKQFLVEQGISEAAIDTRAVGKEQQLSKPEVKALVDENPELTDADKKKMDRRLAVIYLAQNRRVDVTLNNTGQQSVKLYPFNAADSKTLLSEQAPTPKKKAAPKKP
ncbi:MAG TPA: OmpA family protein [Terracidiphilus sp.]|jgi:outer membrane protein OmpA-like peptidoglycan-associated protein|nr:OmpA family protein [Terracidiphilus sp.]